MENMKTRRRSFQPIHSCCRLHDLPDELVTLILSKLPTKDAVVVQATSKRMRQAFTCLNSLVFDESLVSECPYTPYHTKHLPIFESFVDNTLRKFSEIGKPLTKFVLRLGHDKSWHRHVLDRQSGCKMTPCDSFLDPARISKWMSFPLAYSSLKCLAISFQVSNYYDYKLPAGIFTCRSLESLKLSFNTEIYNKDFPIITLPNLKFLYFHSLNFTTFDFVTRLVASCPALEYLSMTHCSWWVSKSVTISSPSLRKLVLNILDDFTYDSPMTPIVVIDTPNLEYLDYEDFLAPSYSIVQMNALTEAHIGIATKLCPYDEDACFQTHHSLVTTFAHVQQLSLLGYCVENVYISGELKDQLPEFRALKILEMGPVFHARWDIVLSLFLRRSPILKALVFPKGLYLVDEDDQCIRSGLSFDDRNRFPEEAKAWRSNDTIPASCMSRLERIQLNDCYEQNRELNMMRFFLRQAPVLKKMVVSVHEGCNPVVVRRQLELVPRASSSCSITVRS